MSSLCLHQLRALGRSRGYIPLTAPSKLHLRSILLLETAWAKHASLTTISTHTDFRSQFLLACSALQQTRKVVAKKASIPNSLLMVGTAHSQVLPSTLRHRRRHQDEAHHLFEEDNALLSGQLLRALVRLQVQHNHPVPRCRPRLHHSRLHKVARSLNLLAQAATRSSAKTNGNKHSKTGLGRSRHHHLYHPPVLLKAALGSGQRAGRTAGLLTQDHRLLVLVLVQQRTHTLWTRKTTQRSTQGARLAPLPWASTLISMNQMLWT
jgi:hypothetical protein